MAERAPEEIPEQIGRYRILRAIGEGGMGRVFAARDPQLDRVVALKLVDSGAEALAMARLAHPNVVAVHDAGVEDGRAFVAMELVEGATLRQWQRGKPWRAVLRAYVDAGRGLAAAHQAGLTHGDFKPDNVLVSADGRVRVADFGLARHTAAGGAVQAGTPGYMAPEQVAGARSDPRSDQYGFCAALFEALFGERPGASTAYARGAGAEPRTVPLGAPAAPPVSPPAPSPHRILRGRRGAWIRRALERGLSAAAEARYPSMEALLADLERFAAPSRAWAAGVAAGTLLAAVAIPLLIVKARTCADEVGAISEAWSPSTRAAVERSLAGPAREASRAHVLRALDAQAGAWRAMAKDACEATRLRHQQSAAAMDLRMACLHQRLGELGAVAQVLSAGVKGDAEAVDLSDSLGELAPCADPKTLAALAPPPANPATLAEIARIRRELSRVRAEEHAGKYADAIAHGEALAAAASGTGYRPVEAEALLELGHARARLGDYTGAERALLDSVVASEAGQHLRARAEALTTLVSLAPGIREAQRAREWDRQAVAVIEALGGDRLLTAKRLVAACDLALVDARLDDAEADARQAVALLEAELGPEHLDTQQAARALGQVLLRRGQPLKAIALLRQQLELRARIFGADNPERWTPVMLLTNAMSSAGYFREALAEARAARAEIRGTIPDTSNLAVTLDLRIASSLHNLGHQTEALAMAAGLVLRARANAGRPRGLASALGLHAAILSLLGRFDEASAEFAEQEALVAKVGGELGNDRGAHAQIEANWGLTEIWAGKTDDGLRKVGEALKQRAAILPAGHPDLRFMYLDLAEGELLGGHPARALEPARTALELTRAAAGPDSPTTALAQVQLAEALVGTGHPRDAVPLARKALELWEAHPGLPDHAARAHFALARALWPSSPRDALEEAELARQGYAALESFRKAHAADVAAWVARARASPPSVEAPESR